MRPDLWSTTPSDSSNRTTFVVRDVRCRHCAEAIEVVLSELPDVDRVTVDLVERRVTVLSGAPLTATTVARLLDDIGHPIDVGDTDDLIRPFRTNWSRPIQVSETGENGP